MKKYKVGFTAGTFDLFHVGHLNILRKSKEQCEYLIVGVMTDDFVEHQKGKKPTISLEDRMEMLLACKYVDEVVPVDYHNTHKQDAWSLYHFDCVFTGNDHEGEEWYRERDMLRAVGSEMIFFPYTERISSTMIKNSVAEKSAEPVVIPEPIVEEQKKRTMYVSIPMEELTDQVIETIRVVSERCDKLIVGIMDDNFFCYSLGRYPSKSYECRRNLLLSLKYVDEVVCLSMECHSKRQIYDIKPYDAVVVGSEYGSYYQDDFLFFKEKNIEICNLIPGSLGAVTGEDTLKKVLDNLYVDKKIVLWGTGKYFDYYMEQYGSQYTPVYAVDSDESKWGSEIRGISVFSPDKLKEERDIDVFVVICCFHHDNLVQRLCEMGHYDYRILRYDGCVSSMEQYDVALREQEDYMSVTKSALMGILKQFDSICDRYGLKYYVISGSLIGVVRHHSLIPWDDDIDVAMTREDYNVLKEKSIEMFEGTNLEFVDYNQLGDGCFHDFMARIFCKDQVIPNAIFTKVKNQLRADLKDKIPMDIYVLDNASDNPKKHKKHMDRISRIYALSMGHRDYVDFNEYDFVSKKELFLIKCAVWLGKKIPINILNRWYEKERLYADGEQSEHYFESNGVSAHIKDLYKKEFYMEGQRLPMDDLMVSVPKDTDGLLKAKGYGDYMQYPWPAARKPERMKHSRAVVR